MSIAEEFFRADAPGKIHERDLTPLAMHRTHERELIIRALRCRADRREQSVTTAEQAQEVRWLRRIADDIADGLEDAG